MAHTVSKLTESKKIKDRWYADFDTGESLEVGLSVIADHSLFTGRVYTDEEFAALKADVSRLGARARALRLLGVRAMSRRELIDRLTEKGESQEDAAGAADYLESVGYLDDARYAGSVVRHYAQKGYGVARIRQELFRRGVPRELWEAALEELPEDTETIDALVDRRLHGEKPDKKELKRLADMLLRRGFSWGEIKSALSRYDFSEGMEDE